MRIAIDARHIGDHFPGIGRYVFALLRELAALDHRHTLLVLYNPALPNTRFDLAALGRLPRVELVTTGAQPFTLGEQHQVPRLLRELRADLYHAPYYVMPYIGLPCPAVVTLYDAIPRLFPAEVSPRARLLFDLLTRLALRAASGVLAISESARADIAAAYRVPPERIVVTPLAADSRFQPQPASAIELVRRRYDLPARYVLCVSSNKPHKNLGTLVEAFHQLQIADCRLQIDAANLQSASSNMQLVIAGHADPRYPDPRGLVERLGLGATVRCLPDVAEADLPALYSGAELFAYPSRYEGFGLPPLEAMACGAPVICGTGSSLPEVVGDAALLMDITQPTVLAAGIARALSDQALRDSMREKGLACAGLFSWRRTAELTLAVYEQAANKKAD
jgi:alpha-1,3-rhamnosyl/mannosyltransferase